MPHQTANRASRLAPHEVAVWLVALDGATPADLARAAAALTPDEQARAARFRVEGARAQFVAARALARRMLSFHAGVARDWRFRAEPHGRLVLEDDAPAFVFNLSHTHGVVACALAASGEVGVDVERLAPADDLARLARHHFSPSEAARVAALQGPAQAEAFFAYWTLKEAYVKARGLGLSLDTKAFTFDLGPPIALRFAGGARHGLDDEATRWRFLRAAPTAATRLALAAAAPLDLSRAGPAWVDLSACLDESRPLFATPPSAS